MGDISELPFVYGLRPRKPIAATAGPVLRTRVSMGPKKLAKIFIVTPTCFRMHLLLDDGDHWKLGPCLRARMRARERRKLVFGYNAASARKLEQLGAAELKQLLTS